MAKEIRYCRIEYVRDYYQVNWNENDYQRLLQWLSECDDNYNAAAYGVLKDLTFDDIVAIFNDEKEDIVYEVPCNNCERAWTYTVYVGEFIREQIQEDAWNMGCYDSDCYDAEDSIEIEN